jgi:hypothetical protein
MDHSLQTVSNSACAFHLFLHVLFLIFIILYDYYDEHYFPSFIFEGISVPEDLVNFESSISYL